MRKLMALFFILSSLSAQAHVFCDALFSQEGPLVRDAQKKTKDWVEDPMASWTNHVPSSASHVAKFSLVNPIPNLLLKKKLHMYYRQDQPAKVTHEETVILIHGLGDHSGRTNELAEQFLQNGYSVLRPDLLGHGRSLWKEFQKEQKPLDLIDIRWQATALAKIIRDNKIKKIRVVGHSYGGAVAILLDNYLNGFNTTKIPITKIDLIAFYAQDIAEWYVKNMAAGGTLAESLKKGMYFLTWKPVAEAVANKMNQQNLSLVEYFSNLEAAFRFMGLNQLTQMLVNPALEKFMYNNYEAYFKYYAEKAGVNLEDPEVKKRLDQQIRSAIAVTYGARKFNIFHPNENLPSTTTPIQILVGTNDELVPVPMMIQSELRLRDLGYNVSLHQIEGAGHLMTRTHVETLKKYLIPPPPDKNAN